MVNHCADPIQQESSGEVFNPVINPYHILQVRIDATLSEIRENYMRLSLLHHPGRQAPNDAEIQRRARVFELLAACYETLVYHRNHYHALLGQHSSATEHHHLPIVRKGEVHVGGKRVTVIESLKQSDDEYIPIPLEMSSSSSDEEEQQQHYTWQDTNRMFAGPLALLYRARHYEPFTNPYEVFESVFGHAVFPHSPLHHAVQWLPTDDYSTISSVAAANWSGSTIQTCEDTVVSLISRTVRNRKITRRKTTTIDELGRRNVHVQVTSEQLPTCGDDRDWIPNRSDAEYCGRYFCPWRVVESSSNNALAESRDPESCTFERGEEEADKERCTWPEMTDVVNMCTKRVVVCGGCSPKS